MFLMSLVIVFLVSLVFSGVSSVPSVSSVSGVSSVPNVSSVSGVSSVLVV